MTCVAAREAREIYKIYEISRSRRIKINRKRYTEI